jgi:hypothetical protein
VYGAFFGPSAKPGARAEAGAVAGIVGASEDVPEESSDDDAKRLPQSFVGIPYTVCALNQRTYIQCKIYRDLRPDRLVVPYELATDHLINDIRVGTISLNASINPAPAICFAPTVFGTRLRATVTATPNVGINLEVTRVATGTAAFCGAFFGPSRFPS